ncbi:hypothetical protein CP965_13565 [Halarcobacter mediterraneus]|uniref:Uncharacterized protein n=1 Tax=Halarcobacter mediterraneus TaxID=2023153 RepID=A0A4Q1AQ57_9BACT|nr:hypothetical protein [Halarcobacter mediterraneus]RXK11563.1 hypothetical protein CP965_13565 [Halarcobacter mediterraneus]
MKIDSNVEYVPIESYSQIKKGTNKENIENSDIERSYKINISSTPKEEIKNKTVSLESLNSKTIIQSRNGYVNEERVIMKKELFKLKF